MSIVTLGLVYARTTLIVPARLDISQASMTSAMCGLSRKKAVQCCSYQIKPWLVCNLESSKYTVSL